MLRPWPSLTYGNLMEHLGGGPRDFPDDRLRYLFESVRLGTMRAASEHLGMAASSISRQIAGLEKDLGIDLIEKNRHRVQLTQAGERLIEYYRERRAQREALMTDLDDLKGLRNGYVRIATGKGLIRVVLARSVAEYTAANPGVRIDVTSASSRAIISMVRDDEAHFGIMMDAPSDARVWSRSRFPEPFYLMVAPSHPLAAKTDVDIRDLVGFPLIVPEDGFRIHDLIASFQNEYGLFLDARISASSIQIIADVAAAGSVATIIPFGCVSDYVAAGSLVAIPMANPLLNSARIEIVTRVGRRLSGAALSLLQLLERNLERRGKS